MPRPDADLLFRLRPLRFAFVARETIHFPPGKSGNILRGAFGTIFRRLACPVDCPGARVCPARATCDYARLFEPGAIAGGPSGLRDWPRPFVFRAIHLDGCTFEPGTSFHFDLNLFDLRRSSVDHLTNTFAQLAEEGLGPERRRIELRAVTGEEVAIDLGAAPADIYRLRVKFLTPTELKGAEKPTFGALATRIRDRIGTLSNLYGNNLFSIDFKGFGERALAVQMAQCETNSPPPVERRSSRTGRTHSLGGFVGHAEYQGNLGEFVSFFRAATFTGVGRHTAWGQGQIEIAY